ncbi:adenylate kinase [Striga asiatica]|uniref:Adenylate kinase n=1 Tax=Striga asiatica TaxID=4170 RepID=A0A5A7Q9B6_STRAF|nr:adenylate kinase [Striga asiatica]
MSWGLKRKKELLTMLDEIQRCLQHYYSSKLVRLDVELRSELDEVTTRDTKTQHTPQSRRNSKNPNKIAAVCSVYHRRNASKFPYLEGFQGKRKRGAKETFLQL